MALKIPNRLIFPFKQTKTTGNAKSNNNTAADSSAEDDSDDEEEQKETHDEVSGEISEKNLYCLIQRIVYPPHSPQPPILTWNFTRDFARRRHSFGNGQRGGPSLRTINGICVSDG